MNHTESSGELAKSGNVPRGPSLLFVSETGKHLTHGGFRFLPKESAAADGGEPIFADLHCLSDVTPSGSFLFLPSYGQFFYTFLWDCDGQNIYVLCPLPKTAAAAPDTTAELPSSDRLLSLAEYGACPTDKESAALGCSLRKAEEIRHALAVRRKEPRRCSVPGILRLFDSLCRDRSVGGMLMLPPIVCEDTDEDACVYAEPLQCLMMLFVFARLLSEEGADGITLFFSGSGKESALLLQGQTEQRGCFFYRTGDRMSACDKENAPSVLTLLASATAKSAGADFSVTLERNGIMTLRADFGMPDTGLLGFKTGELPDEEELRSFLRVLCTLL